MKKPIINEYQRFEMKRDSLYSSSLKLHIAWLKFKRELSKVFIK